MVVIAIIAILAGMLLPALNKAREKARSASCLSNKKQVMQGVTFYIDDYGQFIPNFQYGRSWAEILTNNKPATAMPKEDYTAYISWGVTTCPSADQPKTYNSGWGKTSAKDGGIKGYQWAGATGMLNPASNRIQHYFAKQINGWNQGDATHCAYLLVDRFKTPTSAMILADAYIPSHKMAWTNFVVRAGDDTSPRPWAIHGGRIVTGYLDGHCESVTPKELRFEGNDHGNASGDMKYYTPGLLMMNAYISAEGVKVDLM